MILRARAVQHGNFSTDPGYMCLWCPKNQNSGTTMQSPHTASIQNPKDESWQYWNIPHPPSLPMGQGDYTADAAGSRDIVHGFNF